MPSEHTTPLSRLGNVLVLLALSVGGFLAVLLPVRQAQLADLHATQDLPADVRAEVATVWDRFGEAFPARMRCMGDVELTLVSDVTGGDARYIRSAATIEIQIPTSPGRFRESLAHELAHHLETTCGAFASLREDLLEVFGATEWDSQDQPWEDRPAERWAEEVVHIVNGQRLVHDRSFSVTPEAQDLITAWSLGD